MGPISTTQGPGVPINQISVQTISSSDHCTVISEAQTSSFWLAYFHVPIRDRHRIVEFCLIFLQSRAKFHQCETTHRD